MGLGPRAAGVAALAVVERQVDALVHQVLDDLVAGEVRLGRREQGCRLAAGTAGNAGDANSGTAAGTAAHRAPPAPAAAVAVSGSTTVRIRRSASLMFSWELAYERRMWFVPTLPNAVPASTDTPASLSSLSASSAPVRPVAEISGKT